MDVDELDRLMKRELELLESGRGRSKIRSRRPTSRSRSVVRQLEMRSASRSRPPFRSVSRSPPPIQRRGGKMTIIGMCNINFEILESTSLFLTN